MYSIVDYMYIYIYAYLLVFLSLLLFIIFMCTIIIFNNFEYTFYIFHNIHNIHMLKSLWTLFKFNNLLSLLFSFILDFIKLYKTCLNNKEILYNKSIVDPFLSSVFISTFHYFMGCIFAAAVAVSKVY